ncbi:hypothetical protein Pint_34376 [Pistacia integerrima]|uniref:Uncharacterized protein n=1 Tax=Pistacia integerrima TaxID=434235 RepID=A0ACC0X2W1_9ROSI|nr:hypothetical protein Pint_34376 [Pistacia integerrima]
MLKLNLFHYLLCYETDQALCFALMDIGNSFYVQETGSNRQMERNVWVVEIICNLIKHLSPNSGSSAVMSMGVNILARMLKCSPSSVAAAALRANIFDVASRENIFDNGHNVSSSFEIEFMEPTPCSSE